MRGIKVEMEIHALMLLMAWYRGLAAIFSKGGSHEN
jgi:hypothetical protein